MVFGRRKEKGLKYFVSKIRPILHDARISQRYPFTGYIKGWGLENRASSNGLSIQSFAVHAEYESEETHIHYFFPPSLYMLGDRTHLKSDTLLGAIVGGVY